MSSCNNDMVLSGISRNEIPTSSEDEDTTAVSYENCSKISAVKKSKNCSKIISRTISEINSKKNSTVNEKNMCKMISEINSKKSYTANQEIISKIKSEINSKKNSLPSGKTISKIISEINSKKSCISNEGTISKIKSDITSKISSISSEEAISIIEPVLSFQNAKGDVPKQKSNLLHKKLDKLRAAHNKAFSEHIKRCREFEKPEIYNHYPHTNQNNGEFHMDNQARNRFIELEKQLSLARVTTLFKIFF